MPLPNRVETTTKHLAYTSIYPKSGWLISVEVKKHATVAMQLSQPSRHWQWQYN